ncbi:DUF3596 domain-containing protein [Aeromonas caviae]|uniref:Arm DNA-binding domain-containing protein n=1 Tax=Aeromonas caviae TaxID=648 RepID=UPI00214E78F6|nr:DUF3596 domain-containing protein [Aeromonas caviae]MCR3895205.1 DUF3596 domain-containing protein [Aeromonas caviae]
MGSIRSREGKLFFDFHYQMIRCREQTLLKDTKLNRCKLEKIMGEIDGAIRLGRFIYRDYFPNSKRCAQFDQCDVATQQLIASQPESPSLISNMCHRRCKNDPLTPE